MTLVFLNNHRNGDIHLRLFFSSRFFHVNLVTRRFPVPTSRSVTFLSDFFVDIRLRRRQASVRAMGRNVNRFLRTISAIKGPRGVQWQHRGTSNTLSNSQARTRLLNRLRIIRRLMFRHASILIMPNLMNSSPNHRQDRALLRRLLIHYRFLSHMFLSSFYMVTRFRWIILLSFFLLNPVTLFGRIRRLVTMLLRNLRHTRNNVGHRTPIGHASRHSPTRQPYPSRTTNDRVTRRLIKVNQQTRRHGIRQFTIRNRIITRITRTLTKRLRRLRRLLISQRFRQQINRRSRRQYNFNNE